jgi:hypothetical protein
MGRPEAARHVKLSKYRMAEDAGKPHIPNNKGRELSIFLGFLYDVLPGYDANILC